ncbi:hypothetical protein M3Y99_00310600 [Aphelenchoides fujianensis]|nr:hypothetical protein M3Y99_00310600 [Aphelenchoides fujianensis]
MTAQISNRAPHSRPSAHSKCVPWEPYKAACSSSRNANEHTPNTFPPNLIRYSVDANIPPRLRPDNLLQQLSDAPGLLGATSKRATTSALRKSEPKAGDASADYYLEQLRSVQKDLEVEREVNQELKNLLVNALTVDLDINCKISSMAEDKVRLAKNIDTFYNQAKNDAENYDQLAIENSLWKSKFMAISIRADDLSYTLHQSLRLFKTAQSLLEHVWNRGKDGAKDVHEAVRQILDVDVLSLYNKTPCNDRPLPSSPFSSNLTITCCSNCREKEILLV